MTNTPPEIDNMTKNGALQNWHTLRKMPRTELSDF